MTIRSALAALGFGVAALIAVPASALTIIPTPGGTTSGSITLPVSKLPIKFTATPGYTWIFTETVGTSSSVFTGGPGGRFSQTYSNRGEGKLFYTLFEGIAVPEAASWSMMLLGIGLVGGTLRRRRQAPALVAA